MGTFMEIEDRNCLLYLDDFEEKHKWKHVDEFWDKYDHPLWKWYNTTGIKAGHGGMDYLVLSAFAESLLEGKQPPIDVYDTASWMVITCLSEQSAAMGSMPVPIPDFTNGMWIDREPFDRGMFCVDDICEEYFTNEG